MLKTIKLYGELADRYGKVWHLNVSSPAEAIRAMIANNPGFEQFLLGATDRGMGYVVRVDNNMIGEEELASHTGASVIKIIPTLLGSKKWLKIIVGIGLIYVGLYDPGLFGMVAGGTVAGAVVSIGVSLVLGGVAELLADTPTIEDHETYKSFGFGGPATTIRVGARVPLCYGQLVIGSTLISHDISAERVNTEGVVYVV
jgi:predicted phage tail protein